MGTTAFGVTGTEPALDLSSADNALAAAIIASLPSAAFNDLMSNNTIPGERPAQTIALPCEGGGSASAAFSTSGLGAPVADVNYAQCSHQDDLDETLYIRNGRLVRTGPTEGPNRITVGNGSAESFALMGTDLSAPRFGFLQIRGTFVAAMGSFGSNFPGAVQTDRLQLTVGAGTPASTASFAPTSRIEMLVGASLLGLDLGALLPFSDPAVFSFDFGRVAGPISVRTLGTTTRCNLSATFSVANDGQFFLDNDNDPFFGSLVVSAGGLSATVQFVDGGNAVVTDGVGGVTTFTAQEVNDHCGVVPFDFNQFRDI